MEMYANNKVRSELKSNIFTVRQISLSTYLNEQMKSGKFLFKLQIGNREAVLLRTCWKDHF